MTVDASKLIYYSGFNAFKNASSYSASFVLPATLPTSGFTLTQIFTLTSAPVFSKLWAQFIEIVDAQNSGSAHWYSGQTGGYFNVGVHTPTSPFTGWTNAGLYAVINGTTVTVTLSCANPYGSSVSLDAQTIPFVFVDYTL